MRYSIMFAMLGASLLIPASYAQAQHVAIGVGIGIPAPAPITVYGYYGAPPVCSYGYYAYYPYACAPHGYYGSSWFVNGIFIGAGPWYRTHWRPGYYGHPFYVAPRRPVRVGPVFRGPATHGPAATFRGDDRRFRGGEGFRGGSHGGGSFHGGGGSHGGGHGGRHR